MPGSQIEDGRPEEAPGEAALSPAGIHDARPARGARFWLAFWAIAITNLAAAFDATTVSVALPAMSESLGGGIIEPFWTGTSYLLACDIMMLPWVSISNCLGRRPVMVTALVIFAAGSLVSAVANNWRVMIAGRTVQGLGGAGVIGLTNVLITDLAPLRDRGRFYALISIVWALGVTTGPILGGGLAQIGQWRWIFWINLPIIGAGLVGILFFLNLKRPEGSISSKLKELDYLGSALFIASVTSFLIPVTWGGVQYPWDSWRTLLPLLLGLAGLVCFSLYETYICAAPLIPTYIFNNYSTTIVIIGSCIHGIILDTIVYYMPEYFQSVQGYSPLIAGVAGLPQTTTVVPFAAIVGVIVGVSGRYRWAIWAGWILLTLGCGLLVLLDVGTTVPAWIFLAAVSGVGMGLLFPSNLLALQASVPQADVAMAATLGLFSRFFGQAVGVAIGGTILDNRLRSNLADNSLSGLLPPGMGSLGAVVLVTILKTIPPDSPLLGPLRQAFSWSFQTIWATMCGLSGVSMLAHFWVKEYDMNQQPVNSQVFIDGEEKRNRRATMRESEHDPDTTN